MRELDLERYRARYGLTAVVMSNLAVVGVAVFGVWQLNGDKAVAVGVLTSAFTAVSSTTTAYLGIKAVSNTARAMAQPQAPAPAPAAVPAAAAAPGKVPGTTAASAAVPAPAASPDAAREQRQPQE
ncbi:hypothetical protein ACFYW8_11820 [Streptomyces sp. NPDC002742]|uniref:hypothetical protein n=1 Tax=Streptomyces sp. NPDC002742 TaxID=3364663 RepID=UPI00367B1E0A